MNAHAHVRTPSLTFTTPWQRIMHSAVDACRAAVERMRLAHRRIVGERPLAALDADETVEDEAYQWT